MGAAAATSAARALIDAGASALVSWGMAGGLDPELEAGALVVPSEVIDASGARLATSRPWREALAASLGAARGLDSSPLLSVLEPLDTPAAKQAARLASGACAVDMESFAVASVARANNVPFIAVRVIVDTAHDRIPSAVAAASRVGRLEIGRLFLGLLGSPGEIAPLIGLARRYRAARRALVAVARTGTLA
jgi:adenosylhomocysteine nucleosidase